MERNKWIAMVLAVALCFVAFPTGVYADDPAGTVRVSDGSAFLAALANESVTDIIWEGGVLEISNGVDLTKNLTIESPGSLSLKEKGLLIVYSGVTLTLNGNAELRDDSELRVGGTLINNAKMQVGSAMTAVAPAAIINNWTVIVNDDPEHGFGWISLFDIISDGGDGPDNVTVSAISLSGNPLGGELSEVSRIADVDGPYSLAYAMGNSTYTDIWLSVFHDTGDPPEGISVTLPGDLTVTKTMEVMENDELTVTGDVEIAPGAHLYVSGKLTVRGNLTNNGKLFIGGTLDITGDATNYGYYIRAAQAALSKEIEDADDGDHMRGYYVKNQTDWEAALTDKAHCNPIIVGKEAVVADTIVISADTEITSNLIVEGALTIAEGKTLTVNVRYDHDYNGIMNDVSGEINNAGTLRLYVPMSISGGGKIINEETGCVEGGEIDARFGLSEGNVYPLVNKGLIRRCDVRLDYTHLAWRDIDNTGGGWYENPGYDFRHELSVSRGDERYGMLGLWDYDDTNGWCFTAVLANQLELLSGSGIALEMLDSEELSKNPEQSIVNGDSFVRISASDWGDFEVRYTAKKGSLNERLYRMAVASDIPSMGFYSGIAASRENYLSEFTYEPGKEDSFYAVVSDGFSDQWTSICEVTEGTGRIRIDGTDFATAYKVTVEPETTGDFDVELKIVMTDTSTFESREYRRRMTLREAETEGLVVHWANWRDLGGFHYPVLDQEPKHYERSIQSSKGRYTLAFFYKYWDAGNGVWNYTPVSPDDLIISEESRITASRWTHERIADIPSGDRQYHDYIFTEIDVPKLGNWKVGYKPDSATFEIPLQIALPTIGAYTDSAGGEANWLPEILYNEVRRVYFVPTVDLSEADLSKSEIRIGGISDALIFNPATETSSSDGYVSLQAHRTGGKIDYFTADFARLPFLEGFDLEVKIRNSEENEIARSNTYCRSQLPQAPMTYGGVLNAPADPGAAYDTSVEWTGGEAVPQETVRYASFTPGALSGGGYVFTLAGDSTGARLYLFDENWLLLEQSAYEGLSTDGRTATIWTTDLTTDEKYYLAAHNESNASCTMSLFAGYREAPKAPTLTVKRGEQGTLGFEVSGGEDGQNYNLYVKIDGTWQNRRSEPCREDESLFVHAFDVLENGESASEFAAAIEQDGIPGIKKEVSADITRSDADTAGMHVTWMDTPGNSKIYIRSNDDGEVFAAGSYLRFYHEDAVGRWDFNGSLFGDGRNIAGGDGSACEDGISEMGRWVLIGYTETKAGDAYTVGWKTYIDTGKALGSLEKGTFDVLECIVNESERKVDARIDLRTVVPDTTPSGIACVFALYDADGRMVDLRSRQDVTREGGRISFSEPLTYPVGSSLGFCKVFVLKQGDWSPVTQVFEQYLGEYTEIKGIVSAGLDVRKGSVVMGYTFRGPDGVITYEQACSDDYALDVAASTVTLLKDGEQIGNTVRLDQLNIESDVTEQESGSVLFPDFASLLDAFGLAFDTSNPMNPANLASIPTHVRVAIRPKTFVGGKAVSNPWTPITVTEAVYSDLYMDTGIAPGHCSIGAPAGNRTTGVPFELSLVIRKTGGAAIPDGSYAILAYDSSEAIPVGGHAETPVSNGQATISVLLAEPGSHELTVRVNNTKIGTVTISVLAPPILQRMESGEGSTAMELTFDKAMADPTGKHGAFTVYGADHAPIAVTAIALKSGDAKTLVLTLASPVIGVSYSGFKYEGNSITAADGTLLSPMIPAWMAP